ncbi:MAG: hypothetical protein K2J08_06170 [Ruminococcus sp.]|nr:hypothetical protein [Ruminococcus sp.]
MKDIERDNKIFRICYVCRNELELNSNNFYKNKTKDKGYELCCKSCSKFRLSQYKPTKKNEQEKKEYNEYRNNWRKQQFQKGLCKVCKEPHLPNAKTCKKHFLADLASSHLGSTKYWHKLEELFDTQNGMCAISGLTIKLGVNASIDHIKPLSKYPELLNELSNLQWVDSRINLMKLDMESEEFLSLVNTIYKYNL